MQLNILMNKKDILYLACAGAGKTTSIIKEALKLKDKRILITTFTNENEENIKRKFYEVNEGIIPENIKIQSWYKFLLRECFKPYLKTFFSEDIRPRGFVLVNDVSGKYKKKEDIRHYMNESGQVYSDKLSKLMFQNDCVKKVVMNRLSKMYDQIFIDEVQDMASWDLDLIKEIHTSNIDLIMVGDMLQRTYVTTKEMKNKKNKKALNVQEYLIEEGIKSVIVDSETLKYTHRCSKQVCEYVKEKFEVEIDVCHCCDRSTTENCNVLFIKSDKTEEILRDGNTMQILYNKKSKFNKKYSAINMGKSKGIDYDNVIVYPSGTMKKFLMGKFDLSERERSKLYVALTRARGNVYIVES